MSLFITGVSAGGIGELAELAQMTSKGCGHLKKESGCGHLKKEPRWQVEWEQMLEVRLQDCKGRPTKTLPPPASLGKALYPPPTPSPSPLSSLAIFKNHTQAEINPSNVITDLLKPGVERHLAVPSPGSVKRALRFSRVLWKSKYIFII